MQKKKSNAEELSFKKMTVAASTMEPADNMSHISKNSSNIKKPLSASSAKELNQDMEDSQRNFDWQNNIGIKKVSVFHDQTKEMIATMKVTDVKLVDAKRCCDHCKLVALGIETEIEIRNKELRKKA